MDMEGSNLAVVVMMFMMVCVAMGQSVDPNFVDYYSLADDVTPFENSPHVDKIPPPHQNPRPVIPPFETVSPPMIRIPAVPKSPPPTSHHVPPKHNPCLRKCHRKCNDNDKLVVRKACFEACPAECKFEATMSLKKCIIACVKAIPTYPTPAIVTENNFKGQLDFCYKRCSSRMKINN
ncbi:unnamed protein product [Prunus armeniaca]|uniref:Uncharacterized protein n=1 Tax=Prunus armeniaca TaxID=36596 RepID=A0A6J5U7X1_PRUAR|nr:unnamed protein product [Prunus armeniaca]